MNSELRVLVADDHEVNRRLLANLFTAFGCSVTTARDGGEALAAKGEFDLICLDRHMPVLSGPEVATAIGGKAFLVACTSDPSPGLDDFQMVIEKPVQCADIAHAVDRALSWTGRPGALEMSRHRVRKLAAWVAGKLRRPA